MTLRFGFLIRVVLFSFFGTPVAAADLHVHLTRTIDLRTEAVHAQWTEPLRRRLPQQAWAYFTPSWKPRQPHEVGELDLSALIQDPKHRLEPGFQVPASLRDRVLFWVNIYTSYHSRIRVVHDRKNPGIVYGYIDFQPLYRALPPSLTLERRIRAVERQVLAGLRLRLREAAGMSDTHLLASHELLQWRAFLYRHDMLKPGSLKAHERTLRTQSGQSDMFRLALGRADALLPRMEEVFRREGLPVALSRIPFVESSFNFRAESKVGARGIWQFTPRTAREFLPRNRRHAGDPIVQTQGAARMLKRNRTVFPDWGSTVMSYNQGVGRISKVLHRTGARGAEQLMRDGAPLGFAGQNFFAEVLAANFIEAYRTEIYTPGIFLPDDAVLAMDYGALFRAAYNQ